MILESVAGQLTEIQGRTIRCSLLGLRQAELVDAADRRLDRIRFIVVRIVLCSFQALYRQAQRRQKRVRPALLFVVLQFAPVLA